MLKLQTAGEDIFSVREDGQVKFTFRGFPGGWGEGQYGRFEPYEYGIAYKQGGGAGPGSKDNRLELYLGEGDTQAAELSVRHNGNNTGALIQARNAGDTDGIFLDFRNASAPLVRWGNTGPFLVKQTTAVLVIRNPEAPTEAQRLFIANRWTVGGVVEYLSLGVESANRFGVRAVGAGGGTQRPLDLDGQTIQFQTGGTVRWQISATGLLQAQGSGATFPALKRSDATLQVRKADDSGFAPLAAQIVVTPPVAVSALPAASDAGAGARAFVNDALTMAFGDAVAGGGSNTAPVWSDGSGWFIG